MDDWDSRCCPVCLGSMFFDKRLGVWFCSKCVYSERRSER